MNPFDAGGRVMWRRVCLALAGPIVVVAVLASGCSTDEGGTGPPASASPSASGLSTWQGQASSFSNLLHSFTRSAMRWSFEPAGDVAGESGAAGLVLFAEVRLAGAESRTITFDALQLYVGEAAEVESRRDGKGVPPSLFYVRNAHRHAQTLALAPSCVIAQYVEEDELVPGPLVAIGRDEFCARLAAASPYPRYCWLVIDGEAVVAVLQELTP